METVGSALSLLNPGIRRRRRKAVTRVSVPGKQEPLPTKSKKVSGFRV